MTSRLVKTEFDCKLLIKLIEGQKLPFTAEITRKRTIRQNNLQQKWMQEAAEQLETHTAEEFRGHCKLHYGVPILREENPEFREKYDLIIRPLPYEHKLAMMMVPFDFAVTRIMTTRQKTMYLDAVSLFFVGLGVVLTVPDERRREAA